MSTGLVFGCGISEVQWVVAPECVRTRCVRRSCGAGFFALVAGSGGADAAEALSVDVREVTTPVALEFLFEDATPRL